MSKPCFWLSKWKIITSFCLSTLNNAGAFNSCVILVKYKPSSFKASSSSNASSLETGTFEVVSTSSLEISSSITSTVSAVSSTSSIASTATSSKSEVTSGVIFGVVSCK